MIYNETNYIELVKLIGSNSIDTFLDQNWRKKRYELQVHTNGYVLDSFVYNYPKEDPENTKFLLDNYEPITKGSIWRGIDNISNILTSSYVDIVGDADSYSFINDNDIIKNYYKEFISKTTSSDPNTHVVNRLIDGIFKPYFVETTEIKSISENHILFIDLERSIYNIQDDYNDTYKRDRAKSKIRFKKSIKKEYLKEFYVYISNGQYIEFERYTNENNATILNNFAINIKYPSLNTGIDVINGVGNSPIGNFIPFGNRAILQYRTFVAIENIYGYPRMTEVELPCNECHETGRKPCAVTNENPIGLETCTSCNGTGQKSQQSVFNIYKKRINTEAPELNNNIPSIEYHTLPTDMIDRSEQSWIKSIEMGEDAIYVQKKINTGAVESAESKQVTLEAMYTWLNRVANNIFPTLNNCLEDTMALNKKKLVKVLTPKSLAVLGEMDALNMFKDIISSKSPIFVKSNLLETLLKKYISADNPIHRVVKILKKVDKYIFYTDEELQSFSDRAVMKDNDWKIHTLAYPTLMQMIEEDSELFEQDDESIVNKIKSLL